MPSAATNGAVDERDELRANDDHPCSNDMQNTRDTNPKARDTKLKERDAHQRVRFVGKHSKDRRLSLFVQSRVVRSDGERTEALGCIVRIAPEVGRTLATRGLAVVAGVIGRVVATDHLGVGSVEHVVLQAETLVASGRGMAEGTVRGHGAVFDFAARFVAGLPDEWHVPVRIGLDADAPPSVALVGGPAGCASAHAGLTYYAYVYIAPLRVVEARCLSPNGTPDGGVWGRCSVGRRTSKVFVSFAKHDRPPSHTPADEDASRAVAVRRGTGIADALRRGLRRLSLSAGGTSGHGGCSGCATCASANANVVLDARLSSPAVHAGGTLCVAVRVRALSGVRVTGLTVSLKQRTSLGLPTGRTVPVSKAAVSRSVFAPSLNVEETFAIDLAVPAHSPAVLALEGVFPRAGASDVLMPTTARGLAVSYYVGVSAQVALGPDVRVRIPVTVLPSGTHICVNGNEGDRQSESVGDTPGGRIVPLSETQERPVVFQAESRSASEDEGSPLVDVWEHGPADAGRPAAGHWSCASSVERSRTGDTVGGVERGRIGDTVGGARNTCQRLRRRMAAFNNFEHIGATRASLGPQRAALSGEMLAAIARSQERGLSLEDLSAAVAVVCECHCVLAPITAAEGTESASDLMEGLASLVDDLDLLCERTAGGAPSAGEAHARVVAGMRRMRAHVPGLVACVGALRTLYAAILAAGMLTTANDTLSLAAPSHSAADDLHAVADLFDGVLGIADKESTVSPNHVLVPYADALARVLCAHSGLSTNDDDCPSDHTRLSDHKNTSDITRLCDDKLDSDLKTARAAFLQWHLVHAVAKAHLGAACGVAVDLPWALVHRPAVPRDLGDLADITVAAMQDL